MRIGICGAGVGGLSTAIGLSSLDCEVELFEKSPVLRTTGAGLNLWPNAGRAIYGLGLRDEYDSIVAKLDRYIGYDCNGKLLYEKDTSDWANKHGAPSVGVYRLAFNSMLAEAYGLDKIKFSYEVVSVEDKGDKAICHFSNGESFEGDVIIGADGIYSVVRENLIGGVTFRPNEHHAYRYRAIIDLTDVDVDPSAQTSIHSPSGFLNVLPIGNGKAYWFGSVSGATNLDEFIEYFSSWKVTHVPRTLSLTPREAVVESPLFDVDGIPYTWTHGRVTLLGDAAHPMMPDLAQGASQTLVDSLVLRDSFAREKQDIDQALAGYENLRRPAAYHVVRLSQKGSYLGKNRVSPLPIRYEQEVEVGST